MRSMVIAILLALVGCSSSSEGPTDSAASDSAALDTAVRDGGSSEGLPSDSGEADMPGDASGPANSCAHPIPLTLVNNTVSVTASTAGQANEFGDQIVCDYCKALAGPQLYYSLTPQADKFYVIELQPSFQAQLYVFADGDCSPGAINTALNRESFWPGNSKKIFFHPTDAQYHLVIDSVSLAEAGSFQLDIEAIPVPPPGECYGGICGTPCQSGGAITHHCSALESTMWIDTGLVTLTAGSAEFTSHTQTGCGFENEFDTTITCGTGGGLVGIQRYHQVDLVAGQPYSFAVTPQFTMGRLYIFGETCDPAQIEADCSSAGSTGTVSAELQAGVPGSVNFTPPTTGRYHFAIDSACPSEYGLYSVEISEL